VAGLGEVHEGFFVVQPLHQREARLFVEPRKEVGGRVGSLERFKGLVDFTLLQKLLDLLLSCGHGQEKYACGGQGDSGGVEAGNVDRGGDSLERLHAG